MHKFYSLFLLAALLAPLFLTGARAARADENRNFPAQAKKPKPETEPKPDPKPKPGPREGGADD